MAQIDALLDQLEGREGGALHLSSGAAPYLHLRGIGAAPLSGLDDSYSDEALRDLLREIVPEGGLESLSQGGHLSVTHRCGAAAYVLRLYEQAAGVFCTIRVASGDRRPVLPPPFRALCQRRGGLVLCAGSLSADLGATVHSLLDDLDEGPPRQVVTLEGRPRLGPRERRWLLVQREVGLDCNSVPSAIAAALRQGADVLLLDPLPPADDGLAAAIAAAEDGVLVVGTLVAPSCLDAIEQLGAALCPMDPAAGRRRLGQVLQGLLCLRPLRGSSVEPRIASELLLGGAGLATALESGGAAIELYLSAGRHRGMHTLDDDLAALVEAGALSPKDAGLFARDKRRFPRPIEISPTGH